MHKLFAQYTMYTMFAL